MIRFESGAAHTLDQSMPARPARPDELRDLDDRPVDIDAPLVPPGVRAAAKAIMGPGDTLWRCPRSAGPVGIWGVLMGRRPHWVIEWWLLDAEGELIEAFWEEA